VKKILIFLLLLSAFPAFSQQRKIILVMTPKKKVVSALPSAGAGRAYKVDANGKYVVDANGKYVIVTK
jgi:hypothetical protein